MDLFKKFKENKLVESVQTLQSAAKTVNNLISLISDSKVSTSVREMLQGLRTVITEKPNITTINHYINHFLLKIDPENQPIVIKELLEVFHEMSRAELWWTWCDAHSNGTWWLARCDQ